MASGATAALARNCSPPTIQSCGHVQRGHEETAVGGDAEAGDDQWALGGFAEEPVAEEVGHGEAQEGGQADDGVELAPARRVEMELVDQEQVAVKRCARADEAEDGHRHQLVVERPDPQQPGHGGAEEDPRRRLLLRLQVHARRLEDVAALVGPLLGFAQGEERESHGNAGQRDEKPVAPAVRDGDHEAEDQDADGLRDRVRQVVPAEDPPPALDGIGVGEVRVVHRVVHPEVRPTPPGRGTRTPTRWARAPWPIRRRRKRSGRRRRPPCGSPGRPTAPAARPTATGPPGPRRPPRPSDGVGHVERVLQVAADQVDAVPECARDRSPPRSS